MHSCFTHNRIEYRITCVRKMCKNVIHSSTTPQGHLCTLLGSGRCPRISAAENSRTDVLILTRCFTIPRIARSFECATHNGPVSTNVQGEDPGLLGPQLPWPSHRCLCRAGRCDSSEHVRAEPEDRVDIFSMRLLPRSLRACMDLSLAAERTAGLQGHSCKPSTRESLTKID